MGKRARKTLKERLDENREKRKALDAEIKQQEVALEAQRNKEAAQIMDSFKIETPEQLREMIYFANTFKPITDKEGIDIDKFRKMIELVKSQKPKDGESSQSQETQNAESEDG